MSGPFCFVIFFSGAPAVLAQSFDGPGEVLLRFPDIVITGQGPEYLCFLTLVGFRVGCIVEDKTHLDLSCWGPPSRSAPCVVSLSLESSLFPPLLMITPDTHLVTHPLLIATATGNLLFPLFVLVPGTGFVKMTYSWDSSPRSWRSAVFQPPLGHPSPLLKWANFFASN